VGSSKSSSAQDVFEVGAIHMIKYTKYNNLIPSVSTMAANSDMDMVVFFLGGIFKDSQR
jgi:hypothetical protein